MVAHLPYPQTPVFNGPQFGKNLLITNVAIVMKGIELLESTFQKHITHRARLRIVAPCISLQIIRFQGAQHTNFANGFPDGRKICKASGKILIQVVERPIWFLIIEGGRIVVLAHPLDCVVRQVGAEHVNPAVGVPGRQPHPVFQRKVMAGDAEDLANPAFLAILVGYGGHHLMQSLEPEA